MAGKDPLVGKVIGNYKILGQLGKGGMGVVYKAHDLTLQRPVALKLLPQHLTEDEDIIKRFGREARAAARLNHPNIVTIYSVGRHENLYFIAMELVTGEPLDAIIERQGKFEIRHALEVICQSADALAEAHRHSIVHRDIKPQNIMIAESGRVKVMDFGLALAGFESTKLTASGTTMGTPQYMSPEQWQDSTVDARSDIYSLGITLYEMLAGGPPFDASTPLALMRKVMDEPTPSLSDINVEITPTLSNIVGKMIAKKPEDRYASAEELRDEIEAYTGKQKRASTPAIEAFSAPASEFEIQRFDEEAASQKVTAKSPVAPQQPAAPPTAPPAPIAEDSNKRMFIFGAIGAGAVCAIGLTLWLVLGGSGGFPADFPKKDFVWIQPGSFMMGSPLDEPGRPVGNKDDETLHSVTIAKGFWMYKYEVTQKQWEAVMGINPSYFKGPNAPPEFNSQELPVEQVSWQEVQTFFRRLNDAEGTDFRLPTEAEWEYACRAGSDEAYSFGQSMELLDRYAWYKSNSGETTHPVGTKDPNLWGLYDMHGNVKEWCQDWIRTYTSDSVTDPGGPPTGQKRAARGGFWSAPDVWCRSADRAADGPQARAVITGFRLCR